MALRERRKEAFKKQHGVGLGIASFFVKASVAALRAFPQLNAEIQGDEIVSSTTTTSAWPSAPKAASSCR
jgi:2-oxoglutarate dehydrogenase E2 component (dihydrolipoamide succinyltransferase)